jgi:hypothetical protein
MLYFMISVIQSSIRRWNLDHDETYNDCGRKGFYMKMSDETKGKGRKEF